MDILKYFPEKIEKIIIENVKDSFKLIEEIRLRIGRPIILKMQDGEKIIKYDVLAEDVIYSLQHICENSIYSYQNQISTYTNDHFYLPIYSMVVSPILPFFYSFQSALAHMLSQSYRFQAHTARHHYLLFYLFYLS